MCDLSFNINDDERAKKIKEACGDSFKNRSLREFIEINKRNPYCPPLSEIKVIDHSTGETYTLEEIDQALNN